MKSIGTQALQSRTASCKLAFSYEAYIWKQPFKIQRTDESASVHSGLSLCWCLSEGSDVCFRLSHPWPCKTSEHREDCGLPSSGQGKFAMNNTKTDEKRIWFGGDMILKPLPVHPLTAFNCISCRGRQYSSLAYNSYMTELYGQV